MNLTHEQEFQLQVTRNAVKSVRKLELEDMVVELTRQLMLTRNFATKYGVNRNEK